MSAPLPLTAVEREHLRALAERIAPRGATMPGATDLGLAEPGGLLERVLRLRPDLDSPLRRALVADAGTDAAPSLPVLEAVLGAYYLHPAVKARLGYEGQRALTLPRAGIGAEDLLADAMERPARWRDPRLLPPGGPAS